VEFERHRRHPGLPRAVRGQGPRVHPVETYLAELTRRLDRLLGDRLQGAWVVGSGALGDFDPERSDIDVQAVTSERPTRAELEHVAAALSHPALACPVRGLEFVLYAREDLRDPQGPAFSLNLNTGPGMRQHAGYDPTTEPRFWFILDVAIAREHAQPLTGAPPSELLPQLPRELLVTAHRDALRWWRAHEGDGALVSACRAWAWLETGRWLSKSDARAWAVDRVERMLSEARAGPAA
jgi:hypothetical protein